MEQQELDEVIENHGKWLDGEGGERANLRHADLRHADLRHADLRHADLWGADLRHAYLRGADLRHADLWGADLRWSSHNLISEILRQSAGDSRPKREIAGLIAVSRDWCWRDFARQADNIRPYLLSWSAETLLETAGNPEEAPDLIKSQVDDISEFITE